MDRHEREGARSAADYATATLLPVSDDHVTVIIGPTDGITPNALATLLTQKGVTVVRVGRRHMKADVPIAVLRTIAESVEQIEHIRLPVKPILHDVISEGVEKMNANTWHDAGIMGAGIKIAVIDGGFIGLTQAKVSGEIPASAHEIDYTGTGMEAGTAHGVGVAEIVHDMCPACELYLMKIGDEDDLEEAVEDCVGYGVDVINHSMGWYGFNFFDGVAYDSMEPSPVTIANDANAAGILWVNSAGNDARRNYRATFDPYPDWPETHRFPRGGNINFLNNGNEIPAGSTVRVYLTWNQWPTTTEDYDLFLTIWDDQWYILGKCETRHTTPLPPKEFCGWFLDPAIVPSQTLYGLVIFNHDASGSETLVLRSSDWELDVGEGGSTLAGSIACPADAASVFAVGAIDEDNYLTGSIEPFSSRGPNNGYYTGNPMLVKPDVCGPDDTASWTYGDGFLGTSASSPHVAATACLVLDRFPGYTNSEIRSYLEANTIDLGDSGKDNTFGYGPIVLPTPSCTHDSDCDDGKECTDDVCDPDDPDAGRDGCVYDPKSPGTPCGDPSDTVCDHPDACDDVGTCLDNHEPDGTACTDDGNDCTDDLCDEAGTCTHQNKEVNTTCGDQSDTDCTDPDTCDDAGVCQPNHESGGTPCDDTLFCNGTDTCDEAGTCTHTGDPCVGGGECHQCNEATDECFDAPGTPCGDFTDDDCTDPDTCDGQGGCQDNHEPPETTCLDDDNDCTDDVCDGAGTCTHPDKAVNSACGDQSDTDCTNPGTCDDVGICNPNHESVDTPCDDTLFCNGTDTCDGAGTCIHTGDPCVGGDECNQTCNEATDECFDAPGTPCGDSTDNECTNPDICDGEGVCEDNHAPPGTVCSDGLYCTATDACSGGVCIGSGNPCSGPDGDADCAESCDEASDSCTAADPEGSPCDDGVYCNGLETCSGGACAGSTGDPCPGPDGDDDCAESCDEASDSCTAADPDESACDDGLYCNGTDTCSGGTCAAHTGDPCPEPDGDNDCAESCNEALDNCTADDPEGAACDDGLYCTETDACDGNGVCVGTGDPCPGPDGDDDCTESCDEMFNDCTANDPHGSACDDGRFCTTNDMCTNGTCVSYESPCSKDEVCSEEANRCAECLKGRHGDCDDGDDCTFDRCEDGTCVHIRDEECCPNDQDCDGIANDDDQCADSPPGQPPVEPDGCRYFRVTVVVGSEETTGLPRKEGSEHSLYAPAAPDGDTFDHWEGNVLAGREYDNPLHLTMDGDKHLEARYALNNGDDPLCGAGLGCTPDAPALGLILFGLLGLRFIGPRRHHPKSRPSQPDKRIE